MSAPLINSLIDGSLLSLFVPRQGAALWIFILGSILIGFLFLALLTQVPARFRKPIIIGITFVSGWFYFLEFMIPVNREAVPLHRQLLPAQQAVWRAQSSLNRAIALSKSKKPADKATDERINRAHSQIKAAIPFINRATEEVKKPVAAAEKKFKNAEMERERLGSDNAKLAPDKRWSIEKADNRLALARQRQARLQGADAGLQSAVDAAKQAESILSAGRDSDLAAAFTALRVVESGISDAKSSTEDNFLTQFKEPVFQVSLVIGAFSLGLGVFGLASMHAKTALRRRPGWPNSLAFWISMLAMLFAGLIKKYGAPAASVVKLSSGVYDTLFYGALAALGATMFSLVAFYIVSAAYRAFRMRSTESALMMLAAFLVMLSLVPVGIWLTGSLPSAGLWSAFRLENIGDWIMKFPNTAAQRGMAFGIGVGMLAMAVRIWLSLERGSYFDKQV